MTATDILPFSSAGNGLPLTMSSRDIADLTEKRHGDVIRDIKVMLVGLYGHPGDTFEELLTDDANLRHQGISITCEKDARGYVSVIHLDKEHTITLVAGYDVRMRKRIVDRWLHLEEGLRKPQLIVDPSDPKVMLAVFDHLQKQVAEKDAVIAAQGEQVKKLERLEGAKGSMCISDAAKTLGTGRDDLFRFMDSRRWIFKRPGNRTWLAYDDKRRAGYMEHDEHMYIDGEGRERVATRALVTAKGLVKLAELLNEKPH